MSIFQLYSEYLSWLGNTKGAMPLEYFFAYPLFNWDAFEDRHRVVNYLLYVVPDLSSTGFRCFFFFEENTFFKDALGDLTLLHSSLQLLRS